MAMSDPLIKAVLHGMLTTDQTWSMGLWLKITGTSGVPDMDAAAADLLPDAVTWVGDVKGKWATETTFVGVKTAFYDIGATSASHVGSANATSPIAGLNSSNYLPTYCASVHTLRTAISGRSFRGRVYFPVTAFALSAEGQLGGSTCSDLALRLATLLSAWNAADLTDANITGVECVVASFTRSRTTKITRVDVDSKMDVQHRREDKVGAAAVGTHAVS